MKLKDLAALLLLAAVWGGSFLCMRIAVPVLGPVVLIELRVFIAAVALLLYGFVTRNKLGVRMYWRHYLVVGVLNFALPFILIAAAELHISSGLAAILNATSPLFATLVATVWIKETLTFRKIAGLFLGLIGVAILVGWGPFPVTPVILLSIVASLGAAVLYGICSVYIKVKLKKVNSFALTTCSLASASVCLSPFTLAFPIQHLPTPPVILALVILALVSTGFAYALYFRLIEKVGPTMALTATFLVPFFGIVWGALLLGEIVTLSTIVGLVVILCGTMLIINLAPLKNKYNLFSSRH